MQYNGAASTARANRFAGWSLVAIMPQVLRIAANEMGRLVVNFYPKCDKQTNFSTDAEQDERSITSPKKHKIFYDLFSFMKIDHIKKI